MCLRMDTKDSNNEHQQYLWHGERRDGNAPPGELRAPQLRRSVAGDDSLASTTVVLAAFATVFFSFLPAAAAWPTFLIVGLVVGWFADAISAVVEVVVILLLLWLILWGLWSSLLYITMI
jgi:hypothetical protein